jgi:hypothetical protein
MFGRVMGGNLIALVARPPNPIFSLWLICAGLPPFVAQWPGGRGAARIENYDGKRHVLFR